MAKVLVLGATGRLGGPVARLLLDRGHDVRAGVRNRGAPGAVDLQRRGAEIVTADFDDVEVLVAALTGVGSVIATGTAHRAGPDGERRHGLNLARAAALARVERLVYVSGAGADRPTGVPVFESKRAVEQGIADAGVPATILAPVYLMENAFNPWNLDALARGRLALPLPPDRSLQQVAIADVAAMAVLAAERPSAFAGARIEIASDELTGEQAAQRLSVVTGRTFAFERMALEALAPPLRALFAWLAGEGFDVDLRALHARYPEVGWHSFDRWAAAQSWRGSPAAR